LGKPVLLAVKFAVERVLAVALANAEDCALTNKLQGSLLLSQPPEKVCQSTREPEQ
jgi:hypothetical protein